MSRGCLPVRAAAGDVLRGVARSWPRERGLEHGGWATIVTARAAIEARVLVTERMRPLRSTAATSTRSACRTTGAAAGSATGDAANDLIALALDPNVHIQEFKAVTCDIRPGPAPARRRAAGAGRRLAPAGRGPSARTAGEPAHDACGGYSDEPQRVGFFTDTTRLHRLQGVRGRLQGVEPAPRRRLRLHRQVLRQHRRARAPTAGATWRSSSRAAPPSGPTRRRTAASDATPRVAAWHAPTSASTARTRRAWRCARPARSSAPSSARSSCSRTSATAAATACPPARSACIDRREDDGRAWKCTLCYDRLKDGLEPACAQGLPDRLDPVRRARRAARAGRRRGSRSCTRRASTERAPLRRTTPDDGVGGVGAFFLLLDEPEVYGLPPDPVVTTRDLAGDVARGRAGRGPRWRAVAAAALVEARR